MLVVCNLSGGGAAFFRNAYMAAIKEDFVWCRFDKVGSAYEFIFEHTEGGGRAVKIPLDLMNEGVFAELLQRLGVDEIFVNHLMELPSQMADLVKNSPVPYSVFIHDYYYFCPEIHLYDWENGCICKGKESVQKCSRCGRISELEAASRRKTYGTLLEKAAAVIVPSEFVAKRICRLAGELNLYVKPHYLPWLEGVFPAVPSVDNEWLFSDR
jgi:hypothetical protein